MLKHAEAMLRRHWIIFDVESSLGLGSLPCTISACATGYSFLPLLAYMRMRPDIVLVLEKMYRITNFKM